MELEQKKIKINSILFACFIAETLICSIVGAIIRIPYISVATTMIILFIALVNNRYMNKCVLKLMGIGMGILFILIVSAILNGLDNVLNYLLYFICFGITSIVLVSIEFDFKKLFHNLLIIYSIYLIVYILLIRNTFVASSSYWSEQMGRAYSFQAIIVLSMILLLYSNTYSIKFIEKIIVVSLGIFSLFFLLVDCASRGPIIAVIVAFVIIWLSKTTEMKKIILIILIGIVTTMLVDNYIQLLTNLNKILSSNGIRIPALGKMIFMIQQDNVANGRNELTKISYSFFKESPIWGYGVGYFESKQGSYAHNFVLEILCEFGIVGLVVFGAILLKNLFEFLFSKNTIEKMFCVMAFCTCIPGLMFSNSYWLLPHFWIYFFWILARNIKIKV